jgi:hypothetical protein
MKIKKKILANILDVYGNLKETRTYTLLFGDFVLVKWPDSGSPYWHPRDFAEKRMETEPQARIIDTGTIYCEESGVYYRNEKEFLDSLRMLRGVISKETHEADK